MLSEALDRPVQGEAKHPRGFMEKTTAETLRCHENSGSFQ